MQNWWWCVFCICLRFRQFAHHPPKIPPDEEALFWGWCVVRSPLPSFVRLSQLLTSENSQKARISLGDSESLSIAKNHPKPERFGPFIHKMKGYSRNAPQKVHANLAQNLGRQVLRNTFSGPNCRNFQELSGNLGCCFAHLLVVKKFILLSRITCLTLIQFSLNLTKID